MRESEGKRIVGYVRVSAQDQNEHGQVDALQQAGATRLVVEHSSGVGARPQLEALVLSLTEGNMLAITEVSRLGRTTAQVLLLADSLVTRGIVSDGANPLLFADQNRLETTRMTRVNHRSDRPLPLISIGRRRG